MIQNKDIDVPRKYTEIIPSVWELLRHRPYFEGAYRNYILIEYPITELTYTDLYTFFEFSKDDIIQFEDYQEYIITDIDKGHELISGDMDVDDPESYHDVAYVNLINIQTNEIKHIYVEDFIYMIDYNDVTILQNNSNNYFRS
jgi:hypothetical protein